MICCFWFVFVVDLGVKVVMGYSVGIWLEILVGIVEDVFISVIFKWELWKFFIFGLSYMDGVVLLFYCFFEFVDCVLVMLKMDNVV